MKECNQKINCSVTDCYYNQEGKSCKRDSITVCCDNEGLTKCQSFACSK